MNTQDQVNEKSITLVIKGAKLTGKLLQKALKKLLGELQRAEKRLVAPKSYKGKQTVKQLAGQNAGLTNIEITDANIKSFEPVARKYGIDFALKKDASETPPKWLVFFKARDADAMTAAFKEFTAKAMKHNAPEKPSLLASLKKAKELAATLATDKVKNKDRGMEL
jgi:hypothetical protein